MKEYEKDEGKRHFSIRKFISAKDILDHHHEMKEKPSIDAKEKDVEKRPEMIKESDSESVTSKESSVEKPKMVEDLNLPV